MKKRKLILAISMLSFALLPFANSIKNRTYQTKLATAQDTFDEVYSTGFEGFSTSTTYNSTRDCASNANESIGWRIFYGTVSTTNKITGNNSAHMRWYGSASTNYPTIESTDSVSNVDKITFKYAVSNTNLHFTVYSGSYNTTSQETTWTSIGNVTPAEITATDLTYYLPEKVENFMFKIEVNNTGTAPGSKNNYTFRVDDVKFYSSTSADQPSITISSPKDGNYGEIGDEYQFTKEANNFDNPAEFEWQSSNKEVATIDETGLLTLKGIGTTTIKCISGDVDSNSITFRSFPVHDSTLSISDAKTVASLAGEVSSPYSYYSIGYVSDVSTNSFTLTDGDQSIRVYMNSHGKLDDEVVSVHGTLKNHQGTLEYEASTIENYSGQETVNYTKPVANLVFGINTQVHELEGFEKVTSAPDDWSGEYILVCENNSFCLDGSLAVLDDPNNKIEVSVTDSFIESNTDIDAATFTISEITNGFSIQANSGKYIGQTSDANGLKSNETPLVNNITFIDGNIDIVSASAHLRYNSTDGRFRYYKSSTYTNQKAIQLYKKSDTTKEITTHTPQNTKVNLGVIVDGLSVMSFEDKIVSYGVAVAQKGSLNGNKLKDNFNQTYVGKSEVTLANTPFVYCDSQGRAPGDEDKGFVENTDDYIIFSANLAIPEANYTTELTWAAYFILDDEDHSVVMTRERTESVKSLAEQYKTKEDYNHYSDEIKACINYLAEAN